MKLPTPYQEYIHLSRYARWDDAKKRRETWPETVARYTDYWVQRGAIDVATATVLSEAISSLKVMPSMRALMTAGKALDRDNVAGFNCAYLPIDHPHAFDEAFYILLCGTGVGFSVERQSIALLPEIPPVLHHTDTVISVKDSKLGWASALRELISLLYAGKMPQVDVSKVRPAGSILKTFGGRASGPKPLVTMMNAVKNTFMLAAGRKLTSKECHSLVCLIAEAVVVGGVRRSATISLSNLSDDRMRGAKSGQWWLTDPHFSLANNSICYTEKPEVGAFMKEWTALYESKSGERGIFNREAAQNLIPSRRKELGAFAWGSNPCSEIILRPNQFCNLTEVVIRPDDTLEDLLDKVSLAAVLGTLQSTLTNFRYLRRIWQKNTEEERLLGVSLTGIMDHPVLNSCTERAAEWLEAMKLTAIDVNVRWAEKLGVPPATAITCVKPSGTVSQLVDSASGIHPRYAPYYVRTVRGDVKDPISSFLQDQGVPYEVDQMRPDSTLVFSFPMEAPAGAVFRDDRTAIEQLELWKLYQMSWCEHKPSITVYVKDNEWPTVGAWVWDNFDIVSGVSFLPHSDHSYAQAPYQEISAEEFQARTEAMPTIDWSKLADYETEDRTEGAQLLACTGGACEL